MDPAEDRQESSLRMGSQSQARGILESEPSPRTACHARRSRSARREFLGTDTAGACDCGDHSAWHRHSYVDYPMPAVRQTPRADHRPQVLRFVWLPNRVAVRV